MRSLERLARAISFVGQIGFSLVTPPLVLIWLARLAQTKLGWGMWTMVAAILIGLVTAAVSTWSTVQRLLMKKDEGSAKKGVSFNEHI